MNWANPMQYLRDHLRVLRRILYAVLAATIAFDFFVPRHGRHAFWDRTPGFWTVFGFIGCVLLIRVMKGLAHTLLMKKEDYYG
jgi:hypothetical protein